MTIEFAANINVNVKMEVLSNQDIDVEKKYVNKEKN